MNENCSCVVDYLFMYQIYFIAACEFFRPGNKNEIVHEIELFYFIGGFINSMSFSYFPYVDVILCPV